MKKNLILLVVVISTIFGFSSGLVAYMTAKVYLLEDFFNIPLLGEISVLNENPNTSALVISGAKKVIVEQNTKVRETAKSAGESIVGIYDRIDSEDRSLLGAYYNLEKYKAQAFILTSDGWLISDYTPEKIKNIKGTSTKLFREIMEEFVIIDKNKNLYEIDDIVPDKESDYSFWHVVAKDLPVKRFAADSDIANGQLVLAVNHAEQIFLSSVKDQRLNGGAAVLSSDEYYNSIFLNDNLDSGFYSSYLFDLNGDILGLIDDQGNILSLDSFISCINCLLRNRVISRPYLGVNYVNLNNYLSADSRKVAKGAMIYPDEDGLAIAKQSPAQKAGLEAGDIILSIDGTELANGNNLSRIINGYEAGSQIKLLFKRGEEEKEISVALGRK